MSRPEPLNLTQSPTQLRVKLIPTARVNNVWDFVEPKIAEAVQHSDGTTTVQGIYRQCSNGDMQLWITSDLNMVVVTQINIYSNNAKYLTVIALAGNDFDKYKHLEKTLEDWSRQWGCQGIELYGRQGWTRKLKEYRTVHTLMRRTYE